MSAGVERRAAKTPLGRWWQNWRFHLNGALLIVPLLVIPGAWKEARTVTGHLAPAHSTEMSVQAGPFALRLSELEPARQDQRGFLLALCPGCEQRIREVQLSAGKTPPETPEDGAIFIGPTSRMQTILPVPEGDMRLWLTVLEWNATAHSVEVSNHFDWPAIR